MKPTDTTPTKKVRNKVKADPEKSKEGSFQVVAIGASAGGLEAITELLRNLPPDTGMAFIYVQHLSPDHKSLLTSILSKATEMKVQEIDDMDKIKPDNLFIIPYNKGLEVTDGHIKLIPRTKVGSSVTIDILFSSLAQAQKDRVIGIILSGSATDGTQGMKDIKMLGGLTFAQDESAKFPSMPQSAIAAGAVDFILSPKGIALELVRLSKHPLVKARRIEAGEEDLIDNKDPDLKIVLNLLHKTTGSDFSQYKMNTIKRRLVRRMLLYKINTIGEYIKLLNGKSDEIDILYQDLLINVTSFFRETETYNYLRSTLLPKLLRSKKEGETLRIWVPACASGEEAFSIGMMIFEIQDSMNDKTPVQIFATDLSEHSIAKARLGLYSKKDLETITPPRIQRFFTKSDGKYRIAKILRDMCIFAPHNILADPPFSRLDFISCCNLFIYLDNSAQKKAVRSFYYALNDGGYLMVGKSEALGLSSHLFEDFNKKFKIYVRKNNHGKNMLPPLSPNVKRQYIAHINAESKSSNVLSSKKIPAAVSRSLDSAIDGVLISDYMPSSVVISHNLDIQQFRGLTDPYLTNASGKATFNILKMARPEIAFELRNAISKAIKTNDKVVRSGIEMKINSTLQLIRIEVVPLKIEWDEPLLLVLFQQMEQADIFEISGTARNSTSLAKDKRIKKLEDELVAAHADALAFSQEQEAFTQDLQSANEEVVSSNEELQTLNEELETSKEEIESANEELITTNQELQTRNDLLDESYKFSEALTATIHEPMIVLDRNHCIKSANQSFYKEFNVREEEAQGVLLYNLGNNQWNIPRLRKLLENIIPKNSHFQNYEISFIIPEGGKRILLLNASRIVQKTNREQLILLAIHDVTEVRAKTLQLQLREKELFNKERSKGKEEKERLESAVKERTSELKIANETLEMKNTELQQMNKELESFSYVSSHDLQEPLRKIQTFAGRIFDKEWDSLSENGKNYFQRIQMEAGRMQTLIQDLLSFSRLSKAERKFEAYDLKKMVAEIKGEFKTLIKEKHVTIEVRKMCKLNIIPFQFRQLLENLLSNSIKFSNPDIPTHIIIECQNIKNRKGSPSKFPAYKSYCHITFSDNGIGFDKEYNSKIFEVFQRLHGKEEFSGTGIGLAIVKKIVENHNGIITARGIVNKGASFDIFIPHN